MVKYVKEFEFPSHKGFTGSAGKMSGGYAKGGATKAAPKGLSVMIAVGPKRPAPSSKKSMSPMMALPMGLKKGGDVNGKVGVVMKEFGKGDLHSGSSKGPLVKNPKQAMAIALSEAHDAGAKSPVKKAMGGMMHGYAKGGTADNRDLAQDKKLIKKAFRQHENAEHGGKHSELKLKNGGMVDAPLSLRKSVIGPTRAEFDKTMAARKSMQDRINNFGSTPAQKQQLMGGEGVGPLSGKTFGKPYKTGGRC